ncbi:hypothetical protein SDC9_194079 [bioreactor metagenome]|uniref:Uncharacterized protein n=1 Tax=bioreactor metagenome TaxID=1076179 RepID=A0A645IGK4_9ZZZZ
MLNLELSIFKESNFKIEKTAIYVAESKQYVFLEEKQIDNNMFDSKYSEFFRRPIFILKSR